MNSEEQDFKSKYKDKVFGIIYGRTLVVLIALIIQIIILAVVLNMFNKYIPFAFITQIIIAAIMMLYIVNTKDEANIKITWIVLVLLAPVFGSLLYIYTRINTGFQGTKKQVLRVLKDTERFLVENEKLDNKIKNENKRLYNLSKYTEKCGGFNIYENTKTKYYPLGELAFKDIIHILESATDFIFIEYFIIAEGTMWDSILRILKKKASEGVDVRVMYDGTCSLSLLPYDYPDYLRGLNINCKVFAPIKPFVSTHYNNRDHRKILIVDGKYAFTGGINIADEYINKKERFGIWKDTAIQIEGTAVKSFTLMFLRMWNLTETRKEYDKYLLKCNHKVKTDGLCLPYGDNPFDHDKVGENIYLDLINNAENKIYITTPYLIPDVQMLASLKYAAERGIDVRIIMPHIPDKKLIFILGKSYYKELLASGIKIYEYTPGFIHAKTFIVDDIIATVGTVNLDYRSLYHHFECGCLIYNTNSIKAIVEDFEETLSKCEKVTPYSVKHEKITNKIIGYILKFLAPLL